MGSPHAADSACPSEANDTGPVESVAENARLVFLQHRLKRAVKSAERSINLRQQLEQKARRVQAQMYREKARETVAAARAKQRAARKQREELAARRRWYAKADLTTEEMMCGSPRLI